MLAASLDGRSGYLSLRQDAGVWLGRAERGFEATHNLAPCRGVWVQVLSGSTRVSGEQLDFGDGAAIEGETTVTIHAADAGSEIFLFDLP